MPLPAIIPVLITTLAPVVKEYLPPLLRSLEKSFGAKTGSAKFQVAFDAAKSFLNMLGNAGRLPTAPPDDDTIKLLVEYMLREEKKKPDWEESAELQYQGETYRVIVIGKLPQ